MPYLDAALAFAITMLALATVVTKIVGFVDWMLNCGHDLVRQFLKRYLDERSVIFQKMMTQFATKELTRIASHSLNIPEPQARQKAENAIDAVTTMLAGEDAANHISNSDLIDKLKHTDLGKELLARGAVANGVFDEISRSFDAVERRFSEKFREKARLVATIVAFILALAFNIDSINILESYLANPALAATVAAKSDAVLANAQSLPANSKPNDDLLKQYDARRADVQKSLADLNSSSFPFGWSYFPFGPNPPRSWDRTDPDLSKQPWRGYVTVWFAWGIGILFTGGLAGLGAPFWYDVVDNLVKVTRGKSTSRTEGNSNPGVTHPATIPPHHATVSVESAPESKPSVPEPQPPEVVISATPSEVKPPETGSNAS